MSAGRVAVRYAKALIETLAEKDALDQVQSFYDFCSMAKDDAALSALFANVTVPAAEKAAVVNKLAEKLGLPQYVARFLGVLANNNRLDILEDVRAEVSRKHDEHLSISSVVLTTTAAPSSEALDGFKKKMEEVLGSGVRIETRQDPSILGGAVAAVGSVVYDGSLSGRLNRLRQQLVKEN